MNYRSDSSTRKKCKFKFPLCAVYCKLSIAFLEFNSVILWYLGIPYRQSFSHFNRHPPQSNYLCKLTQQNKPKLGTMRQGNALVLL